MIVEAEEIIIEFDEDATVEAISTTHSHNPYWQKQALVGVKINDLVIWLQTGTACELAVMLCDAVGFKIENEEGV